MNLQLVGLMCCYLGNKENKLCSQKYSSRSNRKIPLATIIFFPLELNLSVKLVENCVSTILLLPIVFPREEKVSFNIKSGNYPHCAMCGLKNTPRKLRQSQEERDMVSSLLNCAIAPQFPREVVTCSTQL